MATEPDSSSSVRRRKAPPTDPSAPDDGSDLDAASARDADAPKANKTTTRARLDKEDVERWWIDVLRVISFLIVAYIALSYLVSNGDSWTYGLKERPRYLRVEWWKSHFRPPLHLTAEELAAFDGTDPDKPIYLAINGTIYDVSPAARIYGPGGSYSWFAGRDASRGFVTGCFAEDRTPDMRGVYEMFLPVEDGEAEKYYSGPELEELRREERAAADQRVYDGLAHWVGFFARSDKYVEVGRVRREKGWLDRVLVPELCAPAVKKKPKRKIPEERKEGGAAGGGT